MNDVRQKWRRMAGDLRCNGPVWSSRRMLAFFRRRVSLAGDYKHEYNFFYKDDIVETSTHNVSKSFVLTSTAANYALCLLVSRGIDWLYWNNLNDGKETACKDCAYSAPTILYRAVRVILFKKFIRHTLCRLIRYTLWRHAHDFLIQSGLGAKVVSRHHLHISARCCFLESRTAKCHVAKFVQRFPASTLMSLHLQWPLALCLLDISKFSSCVSS